VNTFSMIFEVERVHVFTALATDNMRTDGTFPICRSSAHHRRKLADEVRSTKSIDLMSMGAERHYASNRSGHLG